MREEEFMDVWDQLVELGIDDPISRSTLRDKMQSGEDFISVSASPRMGSDYFNYMVTLRKVDGTYQLSSMFGDLRRDFPIPQIIYDHIDSHELGKRMNKIEWEMAFTFDEFEGTCQMDPNLEVLKKEIFSIFKDIRALMLSGNTYAMGVALQLQHKYWFGTTFGEELGLENLHSPVSPFVSYRFDLDHVRFNISEVYRLLHFQPVCKHRYIIPGGEQRLWHQLSVNTPGAPDAFSLQSYPDFKLDILLDKLPAGVINADRDDVTQRLQAGEEVMMAIEDQFFPLALDIERNRLGFFDRLNAFIPLDARWLEKLPSTNALLHDTDVAISKAKPDQPNQVQKKTARFTKSGKRHGKNGGPS